MDPMGTSNNCRFFVSFSFFTWTSRFHVGSRGSSYLPGRLLQSGEPNRGDGPGRDLPLVATDGWALHHEILVV